MDADTRARGDLVGGAIVGGAALLFSTVVVLGRFVAERDVPVATVLAIRFGIAAGLLALFAVASRRPLRPAPGEWWRLLGLGMVGYAVESAFFFLALGRGTAATVTLLFYTFPVWVALLSAAVGLGLPGLLLGGSLLAAVLGAGLVIVSSGGLDITGLGVVFSLASAVTISFFVVGAEVAIRQTTPLISSMWVAAGASAALATYALLSGTGRWPEGSSEWVPILTMGVFTAGAFFLLLLGVRRVGAVRSSIVASLEPVFAAVMAFVFLEEQLRAGVLGGGALILGAAVAASMARRASRPELGAP